jgi:hypothetical protein
MRVKLVREWNHIPIGSEATLGEKYYTEIGLLRIAICFDRCPDCDFTMSRPAVEEELVTIDGQPLML